MADTVPQMPMLAQAPSEEKPKNPAAVELAKQRAASLTAKRRSEIACLAAAARWAEKTDEEPGKPSPKKAKKRKKH